MTNLNLLNRNIENVATVGQGFEPVHTLWKQFEAVMANASVSLNPHAKLILSCRARPATRDIWPYIDLGWHLIRVGGACRQGERVAA